MFCTNCGKEYEEGTTTCPNCGNEIIPTPMTEKKPKKKSRKKLPIILGIVFVLYLVGLFNSENNRTNSDKEEDKYTYSDTTNNSTEMDSDETINSDGNISPKFWEGNYVNEEGNYVISLIDNGDNTMLVTVTDTQLKYPILEYAVAELLENNTVLRYIDDNGTGNTFCLQMTHMNTNDRRFYINSIYTTKTELIGNYNFYAPSYGYEPSGTALDNIPIPTTDDILGKNVNNTDIAEEELTFRSTDQKDFDITADDWVGYYVRKDGSDRTLNLYKNGDRILITANDEWLAYADPDVEEGVGTFTNKGKEIIYTGEYSFSISRNLNENTCTITLYTQTNPNNPQLPDLGGVYYFEKKAEASGESVFVPTTAEDWIGVHDRNDYAMTFSLNKNNDNTLLLSITDGSNIYLRQEIATLSTENGITKVIYENPGCFKLSIEYSPEDNTYSVTQSNEDGYTGKDFSGIYQ